MACLATRLWVSITVATALGTDGRNGPDSPVGTSLHAPSAEVGHGCVCRQECKSPRGYVWCSTGGDALAIFSRGADGCPVTCR